MKDLELVAQALIDGLALHPTDEELLLYGIGDPSSGDPASLVPHLQDCRLCQVRLEQLTSPPEFLAEDYAPITFEESALIKRQVDPLVAPSAAEPRAMTLARAILCNATVAGNWSRDEWYRRIERFSSAFPRYQELIRHTDPRDSARVNDLALEVLRTAFAPMPLLRTQGFAGVGNAAPSEVVLTFDGEASNGRTYVPLGFSGQRVTVYRPASDAGRLLEVVALDRNDAPTARRFAIVRPNPDQNNAESGAFASVAFPFLELSSPASISIRPVALHSLAKSDEKPLRDSFESCRKVRGDTGAVGLWKQLADEVLAGVQSVDPVLRPVFMEIQRR